MECPKDAPFLASALQFISIADSRQRTFHMNFAQLTGWQITLLGYNIQSIERVIGMADASALTTYRDGGTGWTALEVLGHLNDFEDVFIQRAKITVEQENGALPFPKPDDLALEHQYNTLSIESVMESWKSRREALIAYLKERAATDWERIAMHPVRGPLTLFDQLTLVTMHDSLHLEQMTRTLTEKRRE
jgi:uncharacterized damage-inducible protein DinB